MFEILWPTDQVAQYVLLGLGGLFAAWLLMLVTACYRIWRSKQRIGALEDVSGLEELRARSERLETGIPEDAFSKFCDSVGVSTGRPLAKHVKAIYDAGRSEGRFNAEDLLAHTSGRLFRQNQVLKSVLGLFIIVGLLGTLIGLSQALASFSTAAPGGDMAAVLQDVLVKLKTALAPSIWGVLLTISGVGGYALYIRFACVPLRSKIEWETLNNWVPTLYPTRSQKTKETLEEAERQLRENMEAAREVAQFARDVDEELADFDSRVRMANQVLASFSEAMRRADGAAERLEGAMGKVSESQEAVQQLAQQAIERSNEVQGLVQVLGTQNDRIAQQLEEFKAAEDGRREKEEATREALEETIASANQALTSIEDRNEEIVNALAEPVIARLEEVQTGLQGVDETLYKRLGEMKSGLGRLESPVEESARQIEMIGNTFSQSVERLIRDLHADFQDQNSGLSATKEELATLNSNLNDLVESQSAVVRAVKANGVARRPSPSTSRWHRIKNSVKGWWPWNGKQ